MPAQYPYHPHPPLYPCTSTIALSHRYRPPPSTPEFFAETIWQCNDECRYFANDGECDDGGPADASDACVHTDFKSDLLPVTVERTVRKTLNYVPASGNPDYMVAGETEDVKKSFTVVFYSTDCSDCESLATLSPALQRGALPRLTSPCLASPHLASPRLASPHLASPRLTLPCLASPCLALPCLVSTQPSTSRTRHRHISSTATARLPLKLTTTPLAPSSRTRRLRRRTRSNRNPIHRPSEDQPAGTSSTQLDAAQRA